MSSRYDELERLQRLRESGALTDDEFQAEKRRLLGHGTIAPAVEEAGGAGAEAPSRRAMWSRCPPCRCCRTLSPERRAQRCP